MTGKSDPEQLSLTGSGPYLIVLQALPMGDRRSEGRLLIVHCDDNQMTLAFARK